MYVYKYTLTNIYMYICMCVDTYSKDWKETHQNVSSSYSRLAADDFSILRVLFCLF